MGIQIYIQKEALNERNVKYTSSKQIAYIECKCGWQSEGFCPKCNTEAKEVYDTVFQIDGLSVVMTDLGETMYSNANRYGRSRKPLLEFIDRHGLLAGQDWYEA